MIRNSLLVCVFLLFSCSNSNDVITVPDFNGIYVMDLDSLVNSHTLRYEIIDSVFDKSRKKGVVVNQDPIPNSLVKKNRRIYFTINALTDKVVSFPDIFDLTLRQAVSMLDNNGFNVGKIDYKEDIATNKVLGFQVDGLPVKVGQKLSHGTIVDLVVGRFSLSEETLVPDLAGLSRREVNIVLKSASLNIGSEYFSGLLLDSNSAVLYRQYPQNLKTVTIGSTVDLYFKSNNKDTL